MYQDPKYLNALDEWAMKKGYWITLKSLEGTPDLEWDTIDMDDPETWGNYLKEMNEAGLSDIEISRIVNAVSEACGLDQAKIDEATESFLASREMEQLGKE